MGFLEGIGNTLLAPFTGYDREQDAMNEANDITRRNADYIAGLEVPDLRWTDYSPETAQYQTISEDPAIRSAQMAALSKMAGLSDSGMSAQDELGYYKAKSLGDQMARSGSQAAIQDAQNRGVSGSGLEFAMREMANQAGAQRAHEASLQQASDSARQRALYNQAYGQQLAQTRQQDLAANKTNADIINQFNMANTQARNQAQQYNIQGRQGTQQQNYNNQLDKRKAVAGANDQIRQNALARSASAAQDKDKLWALGGQAAAAYASS